MAEALTCWLAAAIAAAGIACSSAASGPPAPGIVFAADRAPSVSGEIYSVDANGTVVDLSRSPFEDTDPLVSPNGQRVAFFSDRGGPAAVYVVGLDGVRAKRVASPALVEPGPGQLVWAPNGRSLALVSGSRRGRLSLIAPGRNPRLIARSPYLYGPSWSPDGKLIAVAANRGTEAFTITGKLAWHAPGRLDGWSSVGRFATTDAGSTHVFDERGHSLRLFPGRSAAWSPNGKRLASLGRGRLEVRAGGLHVTFRKVIHGLTGHNGLIWIDSQRVVIGFDSSVLGVDTATGKTFHATLLDFGTRSPDGRFVVDTPKIGSGFSLSVSHLDGSDARVYTDLPGCWDDAAFVAAVTSLQFVPGAQRSLVYQSYCPEPFAALYAVGSDGSGLARLTGVSEEETYPQWSPDGAEIAFVRSEWTGLSCKGCPSAVVVAHADGSQPRFLTNPQEDFDASPSWSPDGTRILFSRSSATSPGTLMVVPAAGGTVQSLDVIGSQPAWGPSRIAYIDYDTNPTSLWTASPNGSDPQKIAEASGDGASLLPAWSHDGRLAYIAGKSTVAVVGGGVTTKVQLPFAVITALAWSPDGTRFVVSARSPKTAAYDVYTVRTDGTDLQRLTHDLDASGPNWR